MAHRHIQSLLDAIDRLAGVAIGVVGDLVADLYVSGKSDRVSREAPVLILQYEEEWLRPGGAANVAANLAALGAGAHVLGIIGEDEIGKQLLNVIRESAGPGEVHCEQVLAVPHRETITKTRFLAGAKLTSRQQVLRLDRQPERTPDAKMLRALEERIARVDANVAAWVISDYGYGGFDDVLRDRFRQIARQKPVLADSRFGIHHFRGVTVIKPNEEEAEAAASALGLDIADSLPSTLAKKLEAGAALVTLGNKGMILGRDGGCLSIPAVGTEEIVDLTGAGDSVAATVAAALAGGAEIETACRLANHSGAVVVMKEGAATVSPDELRNSVQTREQSARGEMGQVIVDREMLAKKVAELRATTKSIVFANGAFDLIHVGHVRYLAGAVAEGDALIVGVNSDESIRRYKGLHRPLQPLTERMEIVAAFSGVTVATPFDEPTCDRLLELIRPDVHAKGPDYTPDNLPEYPTLQRLGIRLAIVGDPKDHSSTELIQRLNK